MATVAAVSYFKRYKMELDLADLPVPAQLPGYSWLPWSEDLLEVHADVLYRSFHQEMDSLVFPSLGDPAGCRLLMAAVSRKWGFLPEATWLLMGPSGPCGSIQGLHERSGLGAIQNLGIVPGERGRGAGRTLLLLALVGFRQAGLARASLEVTAQNDPALRLYQHLGFRRRKTLYKAVATSAFANEPARALFASLRL